MSQNVYSYTSWQRTSAPPTWESELMYTPRRSGVRNSFIREGYSPANNYGDGPPPPPPQTPPPTAKISSSIQSKIEKLSERSPSLQRAKMSSYNTSSSYNRTYEKKVVEEGTPRIRVTTQTHTPLATVIPDIGNIHQNMMSHFPNLSVSPSNVNFSNFAGSVTSLRTSDTSFHATMDVSMYDADALKVSVIDQFIVIEGSHGEKEDTFGSIERTFKRKFALPKSIPPEAVSSQLTADGVLTIDATAPEPKGAEGTRSIPIKVVTNGDGEQQK